MNAPSSAAAESPVAATTVAEQLAGLRRELNRTLLGKSEVVELLLAAVLARGHVLFDDLPGLGKTTLAKSLASAIGGRFTRIQCTPDLLPSDITGFNILNQKSREFEFRPGPVFSDVLLTDEINRATPRTQSALFEAMAERQVTIDGQPRQLSSTFLVLATQNPVESHGAYPLPEAQLDRFAMKLRIGYPDRSSSLEMLARHIGPQDYESRPTPQVIGPEQLSALQQQAASVAVELPLREYLVALAEATRQHPAVQLGLSPRGLILWQRVAQAWAFLQTRQFVTPDDIQQVATSVLDVRLAGNESHMEGVVQEILEAVPVP
jgi:MoxR-like ATPase